MNKQAFAHRFYNAIYIFLKLLMFLGIIIVLIIFVLLAILSIVYYYECEAPPSLEYIEGIFGVSFENTPVRVIDGYDACDWGSDVVISAEIKSRDGTNAFIDEIGKLYPLIHEPESYLSYYQYDGQESINIWCDHQENTCILEFAVCC